MCVFQLKLAMIKLYLLKFQFVLVTIEDGIIIRRPSTMCMCKKRLLRKTVAEFLRILQNFVGPASLVYHQLMFFSVKICENCWENVRGLLGKTY
jgi:hypothetical protein